MEITIHVTQEDIEKGRRDDVCWCPIALAAKRAGLKGVEVDASQDANKSWGWLWTTNECFRLPKEAIDFISAFDSSEPVQPFSFVVSYE